MADGDGGGGGLKEGRAGEGIRNGREKWVWVAASKVVTERARKQRWPTFTRNNFSVLFLHNNTIENLIHKMGQINKYIFK